MSSFNYEHSEHDDEESSLAAADRKKALYSQYLLRKEIMEEQGRSEEPQDGRPNSKGGRPNSKGERPNSQGGRPSSGEGRPNSRGDSQSSRGDSQSSREEIVEQFTDEDQGSIERNDSLEGILSNEIKEELDHESVQDQSDDYVQNQDEQNSYVQQEEEQDEVGSVQQKTYKIQKDPPRNNKKNPYQRGGEYQQESNSDEEEYEGEYENEGAISSDWRAMQQEYLANQGRQRSRSRMQNLRDPSPARRQADAVGNRLYNHAMLMKKKKEAMYKNKKLEEEQIKPKLELVTAKKSQGSTGEGRARSSSTPRCLHLYEQGLVMNRRKKMAKEQQEKEMVEKSKLQLVSRSSSRARQASSVPRHIHLYEKAKLKQMKEKRKEADLVKKEQKKNSRRNVSTPQRINHLYELSKDKQKEGRQKRDKIELSKKLDKNPNRSASVGRRMYTEPLDVGLYDRGMAKLRALEIKRARAAAERDDEQYKKSPLLTLH